MFRLKKNQYQVKIFQKKQTCSFMKHYCYINSNLHPVHSFFKENERQHTKNYKVVNILNCFCKVCKKFLPAQLKPFTNVFLSAYMAVCREKYSTNQLLICVMKKGKEKRLSMKNSQQHNHTFFSCDYYCR